MLSSTVGDSIGGTSSWDERTPPPRLFFPNSLYITKTKFQNYSFILSSYFIWIWFLHKERGRESIFSINYPGTIYQIIYLFPIVSAMPASYYISIFHICMRLSPDSFLFYWSILIGISSKRLQNYLDFIDHETPW